MTKALLLLAAVLPARAYHLQSAELTYRWLSGNTYELILKTAISCPTTGTLHLLNP